MPVSQPVPTNREERALPCLRFQIITKNAGGGKTMRQTFLAATFTASLLLIPNIALSDELTDLKTEIKKMAEKDRVLQEEMEKQKEVTGRLQKKMDALESDDAGLLNDEAPMIGNHGDHASGIYSGEHQFADIPKLKINGFGDMGFGLRTGKNEHDKTFKLGEISLFMTSEISERVSFFGELVFYPFSTIPRYVLEWQRVTLRYALSDRFNIAIGRMHTALGFWNHAYHHGSWLQTTIFRPEIYRFEYDNGLLPVHTIGIEFSGAQAFHPLDLEYRVGVVNGRAKDIQSIHNFNDENDAKAVSVLVSVKPHLIEGLQIGANVYIDRIPPNPNPAGGAPVRNDQLDERIVGGHLVYLQQGAELLGEIFKIYHHDRPSGNDFDTVGYYLQGGYKIEKWTPYYRFDFINLAEGDPFFIPLQTDISKHTLGVRWDILTWNALKFEYGRTRRPDSAREESLNINSSFAF
jgi:hypothetical protein